MNLDGIDNGDRVKVALEGVIYNVGQVAWIRDDSGNHIRLGDTAAVVEKVVKPESGNIYRDSDGDYFIYMANEDESWHVWAGVGNTLRYPEFPVDKVDLNESLYITDLMEYTR